MSERIHIVVDREEKERYRLQARRKGISLSEWLREAAREKLGKAETRARLDTVEDLAAFFEACDQREEGREPDWDEHRRTIEGSIRSGAARESEPDREGEPDRESERERA